MNELEEVLQHAINDYNRYSKKYKLSYELEENKKDNCFFILYYVDLTTYERPEIPLKRIPILRLANGSKKDILRLAFNELLKPSFVKLIEINNNYKNEN
jgi:hypothetical protein